MALYSIGHSCLGAEHRAKVVRIDGNEPIIRNDGVVSSSLTSGTKISDENQRLNGDFCFGGRLALV